MGMLRHPHISLVYVLNPLAHQFAGKDASKVIHVDKGIYLALSG